MKKSVISLIMAIVVCFGFVTPITVAAQNASRFVILEQDIPGMTDRFRISLSEQPISYMTAEEAFNAGGERHFTINVGTSLVFEGVTLRLNEYPPSSPPIGWESNVNYGGNDLDAEFGSPIAVTFAAPGQYVIVLLGAMGSNIFTVVGDALEGVAVATPPVEELPIEPVDPSFAVDPVVPPAAPVATSLRLAIDNTNYFRNGILQQMDAAPFIADGRTMVPLALISEALGATTSWNADTRTVTIVQGATTLTLTIGQALSNNMGTPVIRNDRTFVPIAYISEMLGATVRWDGDARAVYITQ